ncbi:hypothetical protein V3C99_002706, partial [Haemonchus contortus]
KSPAISLLEGKRRRELPRYTKTSPKKGK